MKLLPFDFKYRLVSVVISVALWTVAITVYYLFCTPINVWLVENFLNPSPLGPIIERVNQELFLTTFLWAPLITGLFFVAPLWLRASARARYAQTLDALVKASEEKEELGLET
jgi:hypothetical protein